MEHTNAVQLHAIADAYRFVGLFLELPTAEIASAVVSGDAAADLQAILVEMGVEAQRARGFAETMGKGDNSDADAELHSLRREFTRLFTNPEHPLVSVYEAIFKKANDFDTSQLTFISPTALDAERQYKAWDLEMGGEHRESPDHMGAELNFLCFLYSKAADSVEANDAHLADKAVLSIEEFKRTHFDKWAASFFASVARSAQTSAYRAVGEMGGILADLPADNFFGRNRGK